MIKTNKFITKAIASHGDRFCYDKVDYRDAKTKVIIGCPDHGDFLQTPDAHVRGQGCPACGKINRAVSKRNTSSSQFVPTATALHNGRYNYDQVNYTGVYNKVSIVCVVHGAFEQSPANHLAGNGCPKCANISRIETKRDTLDEFIKKANAVHNTKYGYDKVIVGSPNEKVIIECPIHGEFTKLRSKHIGGEGCPTCGIATGSDKHRLSLDEFTEKSRKAHGDLYDYSKSVYVSYHDLVCIVCSQHGDFFQSPSNHFAGQGCPKCGVKARSGPRITNDEFIQRVAKVHDGKYDYSMVNYTGSHNYVDVICKTHGRFSIMATNHLSGKGCNKCARIRSSGERAVYEYILSIGVTAEVSDRSIIAPYELDIVVSDQKVAIEYCGNYWHSQLNGKSRKYHLDKLEFTESQGYRLLTIFEDEWKNHQEIVESRIRNILGKSERGVGARKLSIQEVDYPTARDFCNAHHIQGATSHMAIRYGAFHNDQLVALMTFNKSRRALGGDGSVYELVRFVTDGKSYAGIASRLLTTFRKSYSGDIISYADRRWSDGGLYRSLGFDPVGQSVPNYWYVHTSDYITRKHRYGFQKAKVVKQFDADPSMTEWEIMQANGYDRIWDCGNYKFLLQGN